MSLYQLQKLIYHVNRDVERRENYRQDAGAFVKKYDLSELLRPFTLLNKVSNEDYGKALKGLV
jgi:hypothetical protein